MAIITVRELLWLTKDSKLVIAWIKWKATDNKSSKKKKWIKIWKPCLRSLEKLKITRSKFGLLSVYY